MKPFWGLLQRRECFCLTWRGRLVVLDLLLVYWQNWQVLSAGVLTALALVVLVVNMRDAFRH